MRKKSLQDEQMSDAVYVERAATWARDLTAREMRGPGDLESAWHRLEQRYGIPVSAFWSLRYRRPKEIAVSLFVRLYAAYQQETERQMRKLEHELAITKAIAGADDAAVVAAAAVVDATKE